MYGRSSFITLIFPIHKMQTVVLYYNIVTMQNVLTYAEYFENEQLPFSAIITTPHTSVEWVIIASVFLEM